MSTRAIALACRNHLRTNLVEFYDNTDAVRQASLRAAACRIMPDEKPTPSCGEEFISVFGSAHRPPDARYNIGIEESFGVTIAVTRKIALVPRDHRGEFGYLLDDEAFGEDWITIEARCREIVGLLDKNYTLMQAANSLLEAPSDPTSGVRHGFTEPLYWIGTDPNPQQVGAEHFCAYHSGVDQGSARLPGAPEADDVYGLLMLIRFDGAIRLQPTGQFDIAAS